MLEGLCRNAYEKSVISFLLKIPSVQRCNPFYLTACGCFIGIAVAPLLLFGWNKTALAALLLSGFLDTLDGSVSRFQNRMSAKGAVWDIVSDRAVEFSVVLGLYWVDPHQRALLTIGMLGSILLCISSFLVVGIFTEHAARKDSAIKKSFHYSPGLMERAEAFLLWGAMMLVPQAFGLLSSMFILLVLITTGVRLFQFSSLFKL